MGMFFYLYGLNSRFLWEDETVTANLAVNILKYGIPRGDDGTNRLIFSSPNDLDKDSMWVFSPWLSEYITAASFALLGKSEFSARVPFAGLGFLSAIFLFYIVWDCFKDRQLSLITLLLLLTNEALILHCRQCRYYAISFSMQVLFIYAFYLLLQRKRFGIALMVTAITAQCYSSYLFVPGNLLLAAAAGIAFRKKYPGMFRDLTIAGVAVLSLALIWVIYARLWVESIYVSSDIFHHRLLFYIMEINMTMFPLLMLPLVIFFKRGDFAVNSISKDMIYFMFAMIPSQFLFILKYQSF
ncbi:MAG: glycosyltransferase family 39 protein, partial [Nitrospirae bacterium]|nr:glycosyltransferase family 39 protein [Nitrospirota bacterium]